ncbi:glutathione peroxidase [Staphylococcus simiae]|uniref:Glutathione peroxidase n=1 Tax=Staphylococcus simiae CCM 7213 = CCUG 51256 TaxID=911238 RepID=G5JKG5_9STAP|nr:glutathione peroxidase [Staphylococcus simiae]EHJ07336.1 glutathione peroxidase [Staphylococcus simiae CCM 7213 = CCUG 51256]PNZ14848.1 glutathione peroxidase [Staphylococcus simiae]SNV84143.1 Glutathione peroxidase family protein [Staphylococcus simiae]
MNRRNVYDIEVCDHDGSTYKLDQYRHQVILIVNTATNCIFNEQLTELEMLFQKYKEQGFTILSFPNNTFDNREPDPIDDVVQLNRQKFGVSFPILDKVLVNGKNEHPLFTYLKAQQPGLFGSQIKWNFTKFVIDRQGNVVKRFLPMDDPLEMTSFIESLL